MTRHVSVKGVDSGPLAASGRTNTIGARFDWNGVMPPHGWGGGGVGGPRPVVWKGLCEVLVLKVEQASADGRAAFV